MVKENLDDLDTVLSVTAATNAGVGVNGKRRTWTPLMQELEWMAKRTWSGILAQSYLPQLPLL
jgi:hypothetical protein